MELINNISTSTNRSLLDSGFLGEMSMYSFARLIASTELVPEKLRNKPNEIFFILSIGYELKIPNYLALKCITMIKGIMCIYGDGIPALLYRSPDFEDMEEEFDEDNMIATCKIKRKNQKLHIATFSKEDAIKAGLWNKDKTPWITYPKRMLQMRARGFAARDKFADALNGLITAEEAEDYPEIKNVTPSYPSQRIKERIEEPSPLLNELKAFIKEKGISQMDINIMLEKANAFTLEELDEDKLQRSVLYLHQLVEKNKPQENPPPVLPTEDQGEPTGVNSQIV